jgi:hypothetical protein
MKRGKEKLNERERERYFISTWDCDFLFLMARSGH